MKPESFTLTLSFSQPPRAVFDAITDVRGWWSEDLDGRTDALGEAFVFRHQNLHRSTQRIVELIPERRVVWRVSESHLSFLSKNPAEWDGTDVIFELTPTGSGTTLRFTHEGLVPSCECFGDCSGGWSYYLRESLAKLVTTGEGVPEKRPRKQ
jgi:uncharacterized protein YndB with AHSA1/START domain